MRQHAAVPVRPGQRVAATQCPRFVQALRLSAPPDTRAAPGRHRTLAACEAPPAPSPTAAARAGRSRCAVALVRAAAHPGAAVDPGDVHSTPREWHRGIFCGDTT